MGTAYRLNFHPKKHRSFIGLLSVVIALFGILAAIISPLGKSVFAAQPAISSVTTSNTQATSITVSWTTDIVSTTQIVYGPTTAYGSTTTLQSALVTNHTQNITGLVSGQLYHYQVQSRDALGDLAVSADRTFITPMGTTTAGSSTDSSNSNTMNTTRFRSVSGGTIVSLSVYVGAVDPAVANRNYQLAIYSANTAGTAPNALIANTATGTLIGNTWNTLPISTTLAPNTYYFIAYNSNGTSSSVNNMKYTSGGTSGWSTGGRAFGTWPATFGAFSSQSATFSLYATFQNDVTPPTVSISAPLEGSTVSGDVTIQAAAADDTAVTGVQFKVGDTNIGAIDTTPPYSTSWNTAALLNGPQTLSAVATDSGGNTTVSSVITVQVQNIARVQLTQPTNGQSISGTTVTAVYTKSGDWTAGNGNHVHLRLDGGATVMDFDADQDHSVTFSNVPGGSHTIEAIVANGSHVEQPDTGNSVAFTTVAPDTTPPTITLTAPAESAVVQNNVTITADASDNNAVLGVQFMVDGINVGTEDTTAPYSFAWNSTTVANGNHTISARARDTVNQTTTPTVTVNVQNTDPRAVVGEWSSLMNWPLVAVHATLMHTGDVLMWDGWESPVSNAKLWNPTTNTFTDVPIASGLFCSGHATLSTGELLVMGGHTPSAAGIKDVNVFNPVTKSWTKKPDMQIARWYPSVTQMPDNRMVTFSGQVTQGTFTNTPEIYSPQTGTSSTVPISTSQLREIQYPQTSVLPNGKILAISAEHGSIMTFDPSNSAWTNVGTTQVPYGVWTSFAPGKYLITGGGNTFTDYHDRADDPNAVASQKTAKILDMTSGSPVWSDASQMNFGRSFHNVTMMPDGKAIAIGGSTIISDFARVADSTVTAEIWDPATSTWTQTAAPARARMYHSTSLLMPDGRILSAGGGRLSPATDMLNAQYYSPPYLFKGPRPTIASAPDTIGYNTTMSISSPEAASISKVSFVNLGSVTHTADWNQHFMELSFTRDGNTLTVQTPASANLAPENYYMVFIVNGDGVPSVAKIVKLGIPDTTPPVVSAVQSTAITGTSATVNWTTDELSDSQVEYGTSTSYGTLTALNSSQTLNHSQVISGLNPDTLYHFRVKSRDGSGNIVTSADFTFTTNPADTQAPTVTLTTPANNATVSGVVSITANATDNAGIAGVQFKVDGQNMGSEDTTSPYTVQWSTVQSGNGVHTITAVARDTAGNTSTAASVTVTVSNSGGNGLVVALNFNENTGSVLNDLSGSGNNGSIFQATWFAAGKYGSALQFDGTNDYASILDSNSLDLTNGMTLEAWVRPTASSGWRTVFLKENGGELAYGMYARESTNRSSAWIRTNPTSGSSKSTSGTPGLTLNSWTHMAATYDGASLKLFINGVQISTRAYTGNMYTSTGPLKIGGNAVWGEYFAGQIDEVRVYNRALLQSEIQTDMNTPL